MIVDECKKRVGEETRGQAEVNMSRQQKPFTLVNVYRNGSSLHNLKTSESVPSVKLAFTAPSDLQSVSLQL
jgi:hypothetical protein